MTSTEKVVTLGRLFIRRNDPFSEEWVFYFVVVRIDDITILLQVLHITHFFVTIFFVVAAKIVFYLRPTKFSDLIITERFDSRLEIYQHIVHVNK